MFQRDETRFNKSRTRLPDSPTRNIQGFSWYHYQSHSCLHLVYNSSASSLRAKYVNIQGFKNTMDTLLRTSSLRFASGYTRVFLVFVHRAMDLPIFQKSKFFPVSIFLHLRSPNSKFLQPSYRMRLGLGPMMHKPLLCFFTYNYIDLIHLNAMSHLSFNRVFHSFIYKTFLKCAPLIITCQILAFASARSVCDNYAP